MLNKTEPRQKSEKSIESKSIYYVKDAFFSIFNAVLANFLTLEKIVVLKVNIG